MDKHLFDLAYELRMLRYEKEDILLNGIKKCSQNYELIENLKNITILPYMWESDRFIERFNEIFIKLLDNINTSIENSNEFGNLLTTFISGINNVYGTAKNNNFFEELKIQREYKKNILEYLEEYTPENVWLLFKIREK
jgi:hypothetical protein